MKFVVRRESGRLAVEMSGEPTIREVAEMFEEVRQRMSDGPARALIELRVERCLDSIDTMEAIAALPRLGLPAGYRIALLITDESMRASAEFAETVAVNRGIAVRTFDRRDAALQWLGG